MADKTGIGDLLPILERLCLEHRGLKMLLREHDPVNWQRDVSRYKSQSRPLSRIHDQFREVRESLQSGFPDGLVIQKLIGALNKATL